LDRKGKMGLSIVSLDEKPDKPNFGKKKQSLQPPFMEDQSHLTLGKKKNESRKKKRRKSK